MRETQAAEYKTFGMSEEKKRQIARNRRRNDAHSSTRWLKRHRHQMEFDRRSAISARKDAQRKLRREANDAMGVVPSTGRMTRQKDGVLEFKRRATVATNQVLTDDEKAAYMIKNLAAFAEMNAGFAETPIDTES